jgi:hypothetical protein
MRAPEATTVCSHVRIPQRHASLTPKSTAGFPSIISYRRGELRYLPVGSTEAARRRGDGTKRREVIRLLIGGGPAVDMGQELARMKSPIEIETLARLHAGAGQRGACRPGKMLIARIDEVIACTIRPIIAPER